MPFELELGFPARMSYDWREHTGTTVTVRNTDKCLAPVDSTRISSVAKRMPWEEKWKRTRESYPQAGTKYPSSAIALPVK